MQFCICYSVHLFYFPCWMWQSDAYKETWTICRLMVRCLLLALMMAKQGYGVKMVRLPHNIICSKFKFMPHLIFDILSEFFNNVNKTVLLWPIVYFFNKGWFHEAAHYLILVDIFVFEFLILLQTSSCFLFNYIVSGKLDCVVHL